MEKCTFNMHQFAELVPTCVAILQNANQLVRNDNHHEYGDHLQVFELLVIVFLASGRLQSHSIDMRSFWITNWKILNYSTYNIDLVLSAIEDPFHAEFSMFLDDGAYPCHDTCQDTLCDEPPRPPCVSLQHKRHRYDDIGVPLIRVHKPLGT